MAWHPIRRVTHSDIITAADMNAIIERTESAMVVAEEAKLEPATAPCITTLAAIAAVASASPKPIRRSLLGLWSK